MILAGLPMRGENCYNLASFNRPGARLPKTPAGLIQWRRETVSDLMDDIENLEEEPEEQEEDREEEQASGGGRAWLLIVLVGLAMLLLGGLLGYVGRGQFGPEAQAAKATEQAQVALAATKATRTQR
jgi:hypothetical protein